MAVVWKDVPEESAARALIALIIDNPASPQRSEIFRPGRKSRAGARTVSTVALVRNEDDSGTVIGAEASDEWSRTHVDVAIPGPWLTTRSPGRRGLGATRDTEGKRG